MPHRGRLNVLGNVIRKPMEMIQREFQGIRDLWLSNENANQLTTHSVLFEAAYTLPVLAR